MQHRNLFAWSITAALAGFLFGFDTVVISGAEQRIQSVWGLTSFLHGVAISAALWGTVLGALVGGWPTERWGRRQTLLVIGLLYLVSAVCSALAPEVYSFLIARFIGGLGVGVSTVAAPLYIAEISPPGMRGRLAGLFQFNIVFGILIAFASNYLIGAFLAESTAWRWMLGVEAAPALAYTLMCAGIPESPRWLISQGREEEGRDVFRRIAPGASAEELQELTQSVATGATGKQALDGDALMFLRRPILLAFFVAFFNQMSGINAILYFAPRLLGLAGLSDPLLASVLLGVTNLVFTYVGLWLIDRLGRRSLLLIGGLGYVVSLGICSAAFLACPGFSVVSAAIDVTAAAKKVEQLDAAASSSPVSAEDRGKAQEALTKAKKALSAATQSQDYRGEAATFGAEPDLDETIQIAESARTAGAEELGAMSLVVLVSMMAFIASHAVGQGAVIWVLISEIFPTHFRAAGQSLGSSTHWLMAALITLLVPLGIDAFGAGLVFALFGSMMVLQLVWIVVAVPETRGASLEQIAERLGTPAP